MTNHLRTCYGVKPLPEEEEEEQEEEKEEDVKEELLMAQNTSDRNVTSEM